VQVHPTDRQVRNAPIQPVPDKVKFASPVNYMKKGASSLLMHGLADNTVPHD
jgi:hypothetical protein